MTFQNNSGVQFENNWRASIPERQPSKMIRWVMKWSGGVIQNERQAHYLLFASVAVMIFLAIFIYNVSSRSSYVDYLPNNLQYEKRPKNITSMQGFTLIELLVVIAIIGLLSSIVFASVNQTREKARAQKLVADFDQIYKQIELVRNGRLIDVTGSGCSDCICRDIPNIHTLPDTNPCIIFRLILV
jgi:prepilin-type N-terminal cleavage/methylation domain-containing protein